MQYSQYCINDGQMHYSARAVFIHVSFIALTARTYYMTAVPIFLLNGFKLQLLFIYFVYFDVV